MSDSGESREEAIKRLNQSASDLESRTARKELHYAAQARAASQAWRILAELLGGVFAGLALGFVVDAVFGTVPWGLITGVLLGFGVSVWMARRTARRLMAEAKLEGEPTSVPFDEED